MTDHNDGVTDILDGLLDGLLDAINDCPDPAPGVWERFAEVAEFNKMLNRFITTPAGARRWHDHQVAYWTAFLLADNPEEACEVLSKEFTAEVRAFRGAADD